MKSGFVGLIAVILSMVSVHGQAPSDSADIRAISSVRISICCNKTTNLIFPYALSSVDRGSRDVIVQRAKGVDNILQVKGVRAGFMETNLTVVTADGRFHSFLLTYDSLPSVLNWILEKDSSDKVAESIMQGDVLNSMEIEKISSRALSIRGFMSVHSVRALLRTTVTGIYFVGGTSVICLEVRNRALVDWSGKFAEVYISDRRRGKRIAIHEKKVASVNVSGHLDVHGKDRSRIALCIPAPFLARSQDLIIRISDTIGGREASVRLRWREVMNARMLPRN